MIRINSVIALPEELDNKIRTISTDTNIVLDVSNSDIIKVTVKCKVGREILASMSKALITDPGAIVTCINECVDTILELRNYETPTETCSLNEDYSNINLAELIRTDRHRRRMCMSEYASNIGIAQSTLSRYESGQTVPRDPAVFRRIVNYAKEKAI